LNSSLKGASERVKIGSSKRKNITKISKGGNIEPLQNSGLNFTILQDIDTLDSYSINPSPGKFRCPME
jgi:hypothetical protein